LAPSKVNLKVELQPGRCAGALEFTLQRAKAKGNQVHRPIGKISHAVGED
jgi:hypothetical protein